uniref:N-lysine methyltransferase KMT5A-like n=1 Tax=Poecilia formosa TaxID=48698 RepID=A0A096MGG8_POEFO
MAKGKKNGLKTDKKTGETAEQTTTSQAETKENKPQINKEFVDKTQPVVQSLRSAGKPRSPLSDSSSMLILEGNDSDATDPGLSKLKQVTNDEAKSKSCSSKEQKPDGPCQSETKKQISGKPKQKEPGAESDGSPAVPSATPRSKASRRKLGAKKMENKALQNRKVTDYFPIRRSNRKTKTEIKSEEHRHIDDLLKNGIEEGLEVMWPFYFYFFHQILHSDVRLAETLLQFLQRFNISPDQINARDLNVIRSNTLKEKEEESLL